MVALLSSGVPAGHNDGQAEHRRGEEMLGACNATWNTKPSAKGTYQISNLTCFSGIVFVKKDAPMVDSCSQRITGLVSIVIFTLREDRSPIAYR